MPCGHTILFENGRIVLLGPLHPNHESTQASKSNFVDHPEEGTEFTLCQLHRQIKIPPFRLMKKTLDVYESVFCSCTPSQISSSGGVRWLLGKFGIYSRILVLYLHLEDVRKSLLTTKILGSHIRDLCPYLHWTYPSLTIWHKVWGHTRWYCPS